MSEDALSFKKKLAITKRREMLIFETKPVRGIKRDSKRFYRYF